METAKGVAELMRSIPIGVGCIAIAGKTTAGTAWPRGHGVGTRRARNRECASAHEEARRSIVVVDQPVVMRARIDPGAYLTAADRRQLGVREHRGYGSPLFERRRKVSV